MVQHAADDFVGQVPLKGETGSRHRVVPIKLRLLELGQGVWSGNPQAHELEVRVEEFVGQKRQQKILQQCAGERRVDVGRQQPGDFAGKERPLQADVPEGILIDQLRLASADRPFSADRRQKHPARLPAEQSQRLADRLHAYRQAARRRIDPLEQLDGQSRVCLHNASQLLKRNVFVGGSLEKTGHGVRQRGQREVRRHHRQAEVAQPLFANGGPIDHWLVFRFKQPATARDPRRSVSSNGPATCSWQRGVRSLWTSSAERWREFLLP